MKKLFFLFVVFCFFITSPVFSEDKKQRNNQTKTNAPSKHKTLKKHSKKSSKKTKAKKHSKKKSALKRHKSPSELSVNQADKKKTRKNRTSPPPSPSLAPSDEKDNEKKTFVHEIPLNEKMRYTYTQEEIELRRNVILNARHFLQTQKINNPTKSFRRDCSGFIEAVMYRSKSPINALLSGDFGGIAGNIFLNSKKLFFDKNSKRQPIPGDFVYFDNTYDRNRNHRLDDSITHIGIVEKVDEDGTITMIHLIRGKILRGYINLNHPNQHSIGGKVVNSYIRRVNRRDPKGTPQLTSEAYHGFTKSLVLIMKKEAPALTMKSISNDESQLQNKENPTS